MEVRLLSGERNYKRYELGQLGRSAGAGTLTQGGVSGQGSSPGLAPQSTPTGPMGERTQEQVSNQSPSLGYVLTFLLSHW